MDYLLQIPDESVHSFISDIPYGINFNAWDVLHNNSNSGLLGQSPAQVGKPGFVRRGKPIQGWSAADRNIPNEYQDWCARWATLTYPKLMPGASLFIFGARRTLHRAIVALEDAGFLLRDVLVWHKPNAHHRAQRLSGVLERRGLVVEAEEWAGWRLGNLAPRWEPIAWFFKPYAHTLTDAVLENGVGAMNTIDTRIDGKSPTNVLRIWFDPDEIRVHETQKPIRLMEFLINLTTREGQIVLDPFMGSGSTALACSRLNRHFIGFDTDSTACELTRARLEAFELLGIS